MSEQIFLIDANVLIDAHQRYYAFDIAPSFWKRLVDHAKSGRVVSIDRVGHELKNANDDDPLNSWSKELFSQWFVSTQDTAVYEAYSKIMEWVQDNEQFYDAAKSEFASVADSWLVAFALANNYTIVTQEVYQENARKRILIPNVCREFNIPYMNTFQMLRDLQVVLG